MNDFFVGVPFSGILKEIPKIDLITTREDEALAIGAGMKLVSGDALVFMQDSGIGNCLDVMTSLCIPYDLKVDLIIGHRDTPEHHRVMGDNSMQILRTIGYDTFRYC